MKTEIKEINKLAPNWSHTAYGIGCRADWGNAKVFKFSDIDGNGILAYDKEHAMTIHNELLASSYRQKANELYKESEELFAKANALTNE
jgi:hypothetical protein